MSRPLLAAAAAALVVAACSSPELRDAGSVADGELRVGLLEYDVAVSHATVTAGLVTLAVTNAGVEAHDLRVEGTGEPAALDALAPGEAAELIVEAPVGAELVLWCTLPGHRRQGMETTVAVGPGS